MCPIILDAFDLVLTRVLLYADPDDVLTPCDRCALDWALAAAPVVLVAGDCVGVDLGAADLRAGEAAFALLVVLDAACAA
jgi:hypothetical protein